MTDDATESDAPGTALAIVRPAEHVAPHLARTSASPDFLSQMLAARDRLPPQRARRQAPLSSALEAYAEGRTRGLPRLPPGFFSTRVI